MSAPLLSSSCRVLPWGCPGCGGPRTAPAAPRPIRGVMLEVGDLGSWEPLWGGTCPASSRWCVCGWNLSLLPSPFLLRPQPLCLAEG